MFFRFPQAALWEAENYRRVGQGFFIGRGHRLLGVVDFELRQNTFIEGGVVKPV